MWSDPKASPLLLEQVSEPLWSAAGVRQGDPCGPCLFALTLWDSLEVSSLWHPEVRVIAYLDDVALQGPKEDVADAYR